MLPASRDVVQQLLQQRSVVLVLLSLVSLLVLLMLLLLLFHSVNWHHCCSFDRPVSSRSKTYCSSSWSGKEQGEGDERNDGDDGDDDDEMEEEEGRGEEVLLPGMGLR